MDVKLKFIFLAILAILVAIIISMAVLLIVNFPKYNPDYTISLSEKLTSFLERITLPLKIARLNMYPPDKEIIMPVYDVQINQISDSWHAPRPDDRLHEGQDIFAPRGTPIFSGTYGYIVRISDSTLGGNSVYVAGTGRMRYFYTHLDRFPDGLRVGQFITPDTVIGFVGNTGNAETTPTHLHLGLYANGIAINPLPLLINRP